MIRPWAMRMAVIVGLVLGILACGKKMPPRPPLEVVPQAVTELSTRLTEKAIVLTWKAPTKRKDGSPLACFSGFRVLRASYALAEDCPGCPVRYTEVFNVTWPGVRKGPAGEKLIEFSDANIAYGHKYVYTVQAVDDDGRIGEEARPVTIYWDVPPGVPIALNAQAGDGQVTLSWRAPEKLLDGSAVDEPLFYYIYRRRGDDPYKRLMEAGLISNTLFIDNSVVNDTSYTYKVRAMRPVKSTFIEGVESNEVMAFPQDMTPPAPPSSLSAIASPDGVVLSWADNTEVDLAGYVVYRRRRGEARWQRFSGELEKLPHYIDKEVHKGEVYYYVVTAVDSSPRQNESLTSFEVKVLVE